MLFIITSPTQPKFIRLGPLEGGKKKAGQKEFSE